LYTFCAIQPELEMPPPFRRKWALGMMMRSCCRPALLVAATLTLWACQNTNKLTIRRNRDGQELSAYRLRSLEGIRDGEKLGAELVVADAEGTLRMQMRFLIGVPLKLESGRYTWQKKDQPQTTGAIKADAVTFLGGQNGPPSLGGRFQLMSSDGDVSLYQVKVPTTLIGAPRTIPLAPK
jgi:hypothetical protein